MKKIAIFLLLIVPFMVTATTYTSVHTFFPGNWTTPSTWGVTSGYPGAGDIAIIANGTTVSINTNVSVLNVTINSGGTLEFPLLSGSTLSVYGNFNNNGTFSASVLAPGTVTFAGTSNQLLRGSVASTFYKLIIDPGATTTVFMDTSITVSSTLTISQGTLATRTNSITGGLLSTLTMASGTTLLLGSILSSVNVPFPSGFTTITLNTTSTVVYQANAAQTIAATPQYGNLTLSSSGLTNKPANGNLTVKGNLTIGSSTGLDVTTSNYSIALAGNFINNGTFTAQSGTVTCNGSAGQLIEGSTPTTFYNLTIAGTGSETVGLNNNQTVSNNLLLTSATLGAFIYNVTVGGNFTNNSGTSAFTQTGGTFTMNGSNKTLGGSYVTTFYSLTINPSSGSITLAKSETTTSNLLISTGSLVASTYTLTVGGSFTNNATFTPNTGTVIMDGTSSQTLGGSTATTFNNLTISSGTTNATTYSFSIGGNFTDNATFNQTSGTTTMTGSSSQIGGSGATTFNKLTIGSGTTSTAQNFSTTSDITISSGATLSMPNSPAYTIYTKGNFVDLGTFTSGTAGTVNFDNMGKQCISGSSSSTTVSFYNLTVSPVSILGTSCIVDVTGTSTILPGGQMACACN